MDNENTSYTNMCTKYHCTNICTSATKENGTTVHKEGEISREGATIIDGKKESLASVMKDLEEKVNPKSVEESIKMLATACKDPSIILNPLQAGAKEFEERVGRPMTYSEMRAMWG
jgi:hypothetical protein